MSGNFWDCGAFDQDSIDAMARAYDAVCRAKPTEDRELVATQIINLAKLGVRDPPHLGTSLRASVGGTNRRHKKTQFDKALHGLLCLCGGRMVLALLEPIEEDHELYRFECRDCHCATSVLFKSIST
jgi:hypothetical protein